MTLQFADMTSSSNLFDVVLFLLSSVVTGSNFMAISSLVLELRQFSFIRVDKKSGNRKYSLWVLPNIWRLGQVKDTKFGKSVSNKMLLNTAECQGYSFYRFWIIKGPSTQIRVKRRPLINIVRGLCVYEVITRKGTLKLSKRSHEVASLKSLTLLSEFELLHSFFCKDFTKV